MGILPAPGSISHNQQQFCNNNNKLKLLVIHGLPPSISLLSTEEEEEEKDETHSFRKPDVGRLVASCHDLVLAVNGELCYDEELALYNPLNQRHEEDPSSTPYARRPVEYEWDVKFYGFGLDPKSNDDDYKVIRFVEFEYGDDECGTAAGFMGYEVVELYSLKTNSWKRIPYPHADFVDFVFRVSIFINGFNYWLAITHNEDLVIVPFDFAKESFPCALIPGPPNEAYKFHDGRERHRFLLAEYKGSLALVVYEKHEKQIELWVWNFDNNPSSSWSSVGVWAVVGVDVFSPLAFLKNRLFYFEDSNGELVIFDCETQKLKYNHGICAVDPLSLVVHPFLTRTT